LTPDLSNQPDRPPRRFVVEKAGSFPHRAFEPCGNAASAEKRSRGGMWTAVESLDKRESIQGSPRIDDMIWLEIRGGRQKTPWPVQPSAR